jgi:hypothetical protein
MQPTRHIRPAYRKLIEYFGQGCSDSEGHNSIIVVLRGAVEDAQSAGRVPYEGVREGLGLQQSARFWRSH